VNLFEIKNEILELENMETDGEQSLEEAIKNSLDDLNLDLNEKVDNLCRLINSIEGSKATISNEIARLGDRKKSCDTRIAGIKQYLLDTVQELNKKSVKTELYTVTNATGRDGIIIDDEKAIPSDFVHVEVVEKIDKKALLKAAKERIINGCHIEKSKNTLRIK